MTDYAELEISIHRWDATRYVVEMRFNDPLNDADIRLPRTEAALVTFDNDQLRTNQLDIQAYGKLLSDSLFASTAVKTTFTQAYSITQRQRTPLRVRLLVGASAPELQNLRWETLRNPVDDSLLVTNQLLLFSRYPVTSGLDWRPVQRRAQSALRALIVIANPTDLADYEPDGRPLAPIDVDGELQRAHASLGTMNSISLASGGEATLNNILAAMREGYDIVYMVNHGALARNEPHIWLEDETGKSAVVSGFELITRLKELPSLPTLMILASCQSAGSGRDTHSDDGGVQAALGPRLAEAGVPSIVAMQGDVTMGTIEAFMSPLFEELQHDGQIDRAVAVARGLVRERPDWWVPVLFTRLKSGRIWYEPGFADDRDGFRKWPALLRNIRRKRCTPILGPGLVAPVIGSHRELAYRWAEQYGFPLNPHAKDDLPQVAQYMAVDQGEPLFPHEELQDFLRSEIVRLYQNGGVPEDVRSASLTKLLQYAGTLYRQYHQNEPHQLLAKLPFPIYITTNTDDLLQQALIQEGKNPHVMFCPWNAHIEHSMDMSDDVPDPDPDNPLVYQLFGRVQEPETMVLTEDDYFDFLIGFASRRDMIPEAVRRVFADTALLFLGFRLDDWDFKVLFRSIMSQEGNRRRDYTNIAVQLDPEEGQVIEPQGARRYFQSYFQDSDFNIYWGSVDDFVKQLYEQWQQKQ